MTDEQSHVRVKQVEQFMALLFEAGFTLQSVLENGLEFAVSLLSPSVDWTQDRYVAAQLINQAAKNLHIDKEAVMKSSSKV